MAPLHGLPSFARAAESVPASPALETLHPLVTGDRWRYEVREGGRTYSQFVEVAPAGARDEAVLLTRSPRVTGRYRVRRSANVVALEGAAVRPSFLPFSRECAFVPELPFLASPAAEDSSWTWQAGRDSRSTPRSARIRVHREWVRTPLGLRSGAVVSVTFPQETWSSRSYVATYAEGIGLVGVESKGYAKTLVEFLPALAAHAAVGAQAPGTPVR